MLANKTIVVAGVANAKSIAWNIAKVIIDEMYQIQKFHKEKANVIVTYQLPSFEKKIQKLIDEELQIEPVDCFIVLFIDRINVYLSHSVVILHRNQICNR